MKNLIVFLLCVVSISAATTVDFQQYVSVPAATADRAAIIGTDNTITNSATTSTQVGYLSVATGTSGTGNLIYGTSPTIGSPTITGSPSLQPNQAWTFQPGATSEGINVGSVTADPSGALNGGMWYRSDTDEFYIQIGGVATKITAANANAVTASSTFGTDNRMLRSDGTGRGAQSTGITVDDSNNVSGIGNLTITGNFTATGTGTFGPGTNGLVVIPDADGDHVAGLKANSTTTTDVILNFPAAPFAGLANFSITGTTNWVASQLSGTSGGVIYFSAANTPASSAALGANNLVIGGGAGAAPSTTTTASGALTFLGTPSSANFASLVTDETGTGLVTLQTDSIRKFSATLGSDDTYSGEVITGLNNSGGVTQWDAVYLNSSSQWVKADANGSGTYPAVGIAVATATTGNAVDVLVRGVFRDDGGTAWTAGGNVYLSTTAGALTQTAPSTTGDKVQVIGTALANHTIFVKLGTDYGTAP